MLEMTQFSRKTITISCIQTVDPGHIEEEKV